MPNQARLGQQAGTFVVLPEAQVRAAADSNINNSPARKKSDVFVVFEPSVRAQSQWGRHEIVARADAALARYAARTSQNSETFGVEVNGRLDLRRKTALFARVAYDRRVEKRGEAGEASVNGRPARFEEVHAQIAARTEAAPVRLGISLTVTSRDYAPIRQSNGPAIDQSFRNADTITLAANAEYALKEGAVLFARAAVSDIDHPDAAACCDRSSGGAQALVGIRGDLGPSLAGEVALGYVTRDYDASRFRDFDGLIYNAKIDWYPTPLISTRLIANRSITGSAIPAVVGIVADSFGARVHYELRRTLNLSLSVDHIHEKYRELRLSTDTTLLSLEARYDINPNALLGGYVRLRDRNSSDSTLVRAYSGFETGLWLRYVL